MAWCLISEAQIHIFVANYLASADRTEAGADEYGTELKTDDSVLQEKLI
jgi:hypothetical protein